MKLFPEGRQAAIHPGSEFRSLGRIALCKRENLLFRADQGVLGLGYGIEIFGLEGGPFVTYRNDVFLSTVLRG